MISRGSKIIQVIGFAILNILLSTWIWHMTLVPASPQELNRGMKETVLRSFINSALKPLKEEIQLFSQYILPSALQSYDPLSFMDAKAPEDDFDISLVPDFRSMYTREYFNSLSGFYIAENNVDIVVLTEHYERPDEGGYCLVASAADGLGSLGLSEYNLKSYTEIGWDAGINNRQFSNSDCSIINSRFESAAKTIHDTLVVFTTCNHLEITILAIDSLERSRDKFDVLVVDDFSVDGTPDYLIKQVCMFLVFVSDRTWL